MTRAHHVWVARLWTLGLIVAHLAPATDGDATILWGFLPFELAYRLAWMALAIALIFYITICVWPDDPAGDDV